MEDWNVVVTVYDHEFDQARRLLAGFGSTARTDYYNVLAMRVEQPASLLRELEQAAQDDASIPNAVSRVVPVTRTFRFESPEEFEQKACAVVDEWVPELRDKSFHVRMHRRGFKGRLSSQREEQFLDHYLLDKLRSAGAEGRIAFEDPDVIIAVETLGQVAGFSCWTREQLRAFPLLRLD